MARHTKKRRSRRPGRVVRTAEAKVLIAQGRKAAGPAAAVMIVRQEVRRARRGS